MEIAGSHFELAFMTSVQLLRRCLILSWLSVAMPSPGQTGCSGCIEFAPGIATGTISFNALNEPSGLAASRVNYPVLWTHNDGSEDNIYAITTNAVRLATFDLTKNVDDVEDIAVGPGPQAGVSYIYVGDIGGSAELTLDRAQVKLLRVAEPFVDLAWAGDPRSFNFDNVDTFDLLYPDGRYNAETLMVDPLTGDVWIATKQVGTTRFYRVNVNGATNHQVLNLEFMVEVPFSDASAGDISRDGAQILLRRGDAAGLWERCNGESIAAALSRSGLTVPSFGPPLEPNGQAIAFLADSTGYMTIGETNNSTLYFFQATCPRAPQFMVALTNQSVLIGNTVTFRGVAAGYPVPTYQWQFNGQIIPGQTTDTLVLPGVTAANAGPYTVTAMNASGSISASATLTVRNKPDVRITEVMSSAASTPGVAAADWWEITSFEGQAINLQGWRFNDDTGNLVDPFIIANPVVLNPNESIVFVETLSRDQFVAWWGANNLPGNLKIISYTGTGLSLGAGGDAVRLWDNVTTEPNDTVAVADFGSATTGISFGYDPITQTFGGLSQEGVNGGVRAAATIDVGSPGRIRNPPLGPTLVGFISSGQFIIEFASTPGSQYALESRPDFSTSSWTATGDNLVATGTPSRFTKPLAGTTLFYRVVLAE
jgi:hypothetical protein